MCLLSVARCDDRRAITHHTLKSQGAMTCLRIQTGAKCYFSMIYKAINVYPEPNKLFVSLCCRTAYLLLLLIPDILYIGLRRTT